MGYSFIDLTGNTFGRLFVKNLNKHKSNTKCKFWNCICSCGRETIVEGRSLRVGSSKSCGCLRNELSKIRPLKHGDASNGVVTKECRIWSLMKDRCYNVNAKKYKNYGGRGIKVCDKWIHDYSAFLLDMGRCPSGHTLDRINVNGNYEPSNCRWATHLEQAGNTRANVWLEYNGIKKIQASWAREWNIDARLFNAWYKKDFTMDEIYNKSILKREI